MSKLTEYLSELNINTNASLENYINNSNIETIYNLVIYLRQLIDKDFFKPEYSPFSYVPSDELSGSGGCSNVSCKIERANNFAKFSALYADYIFIKLQSITFEHFEELDIEDFIEDPDMDYNFRYSIFCDISIINSYTDLINKKIAYIEPTRKLYCKDCFQKTLLSLDVPVDINPIIQFVKDNVVVSVIDNDIENNYVAVRLENVDSFFTNETRTFVLREKFLNDLPHSYQITETLDKNLTAVSDFISDIVESSFVDSCYYSAYCNNNHSKLITSVPATALFMQYAKNASPINDVVNTLAKLPEYTLPLAVNVNMEKVLHLREIEKESFNRYRIALNNAIQEQCKTDSTSDWHKIYDDIVYPEFCNLDLKLKNLKHGAFKKTLRSIGLSTAIVSAGVLSGVISKDWSSILASLGGTSGTIELGNNLLNNSTPIKEQLRENDYYFLWKLNKDN